MPVEDDDYDPLRDYTKIMERQRQAFQADRVDDLARQFHASGLAKMAPLASAPLPEPADGAKWQTGEERAYQTFIEAARSLRDCEMATRKAGAAYRAALDALNRAVAPTIVGLDGE